jgi:hypothetical protein
MRIEKRAFNARDDPAYFLSYFGGTEAVGVVVEGIYLAAVEGRGKLVNTDVNVLSLRSRPNSGILEAFEKGTVAQYLTVLLVFSCFAKFTSLRLVQLHATVGNIKEQVNRGQANFENVL